MESTIGIDVAAPAELVFVLARVGVPYVQEQVYLTPHPKELMLRNHV